LGNIRAGGVVDSHIRARHQVCEVHARHLLQQVQAEAVTMRVRMLSCFPLMEGRVSSLRSRFGGVGPSRPHVAHPPCYSAKRRFAAKHESGVFWKDAVCRVRILFRLSATIRRTAEGVVLRPREGGNACPTCLAGKNACPTRRGMAYIPVRQKLSLKNHPSYRQGSSTSPLLKGFMSM
jgi:hypothetical protein